MYYRIFFLDTPESPANFRQNGRPCAHGLSDFPSETLFERAAYIQDPSWTRPILEVISGWASNCSKFIHVAREISIVSKQIKVLVSMWQVESRQKRILYIVSWLMMAWNERMTPPWSSLHNHEIPFLRAIKKRDIQKHNAPPKTDIPAKKLGRHHINDDVSNAPAIGVPNNSNFVSKEVRKERWGHYQLNHQYLWNSSVYCVNWL